MAFLFSKTPNVSVCSVTQLCPILCSPMDCPLPGSSALQVPLSMEFYRQEYWSGLPFPAPGDLPVPGIEPTFLASPALCMCACVWLFATPRTIAHQVPLSMGYPRQEYWSGLPFPPPGNISDLRIFPAQGSNPRLLHCQACSLPLTH